MICTGYVKVAPGNSETGQEKLKISPGNGEVKCSLGEGKKSTGSGFTGTDTEGYCVSTVPPMMWRLCFL